MTLVETNAVDGVLTITLNDEPRRNALSRQLLIEVLDAIDRAEADPNIRVVVLTNRGSVFCAGANLAERSSDEPTPTAQRTVELSELFTRIRHSPLPFVGRINGHCVAGGVGLAAVVDISVALDTAKFGFTEVRVGVAPAMISVVCLPKMRLADANAAFLRGNRFPAAQAVDMGLINYVATSDTIDATVTSIVDDLLAGEPQAIASSKQLTVAVPALGMDEAFAWTTKLSARLFASDQAHEGMTAFLEKRPAAWVVRREVD